LGDVAVAAGISVETLRKIETGRIPTPAFFTVVAVARVLDLSLEDLSVDVFVNHAATGTSATTDKQSKGPGWHRGGAIPARAVR
jgi:DNA-binding XRE family transcriptional regulator